MTLLDPDQLARHHEVSRLPLLELREVGKRFGTFTAVESLSLTVASGEFLTILGASGSGKTTTLRMIAGFEHPTAGEIVMGGTTITGLPPFKRDINTVFQHYALFPHMNVWQNVEYGLRMKGVSRVQRAERVGRALEMVRLAELGGRAPRQLSGGQQQRVALARALVNRPRILLLDEPLGALDLKLRKEMQLELKRLQTHVGITFLYVTHDQEEALTMSDRVVLLHRGRIEQVGTPRDLYDRPATRYVADFIGETNLLRGIVVRSTDRISELRVGDTLLRGTVERPLPSGAEAWLSVRPEVLRPLGEEPAGPEENAIVGVVQQAVYAGSELRAHLRLADGERVVVRLPSGTPLTLGVPMRVAWPVEQGRCVVD